MFTGTLLELETPQEDKEMFSVTLLRSNNLRLRNYGMHVYIWTFMLCAPKLASSIILVHTIGIILSTQ